MYQYCKYTAVSDNDWINGSTLGSAVWADESRCCLAKLVRKSFS